MASGKYIPALVLLVTEPIPSTEISVVHTNVAIKLIQYHDLFSALTIVCKILVDAS